MAGRRHSTLAEQLIPCEACGYPMSYRHHILSFAEYGENEITVRLCPNCHALYHIIDRVDKAWDQRKFDTKAEKLRGAIEAALFESGRDDIVMFLHDLTSRAWRTRQYAQEHPENVPYITRRKQRRQP